MIASYTFPRFPALIERGEKIHTFRRDPKKRWKVGMVIHHWWGSPRNPRRNSYQIQDDVVNQVLEVMIKNESDLVRISMESDDQFHSFSTVAGVSRVAANDGLTYEEFKNYFVPKPGDVWVGRCIVWGKPY